MTMMTMVTMTIRAKKVSRDVPEQMSELMSLLRKTEACVEIRLI